MEEKTNYLIHYGVKGMKWRHHKSGLVTLDLGYKSPTEQALETIKNRLEGEKKAKELLSKTPTPKSKALGEAEIAKLSTSVRRGNYGNGRDRIRNLKAKGYSSNDIIRVQSHVNKQYGINTGASENFKKQVNEEFASSNKTTSEPKVTVTKTTSSSTSNSNNKKSSNNSSKTSSKKKAKTTSKRKKTKSRKTKSLVRVTRKTNKEVEENEQIYNNKR